jgi:hypothetical protein
VRHHVGDPARLRERAREDAPAPRVRLRADVEEGLREPALEGVEAFVVAVVLLRVGVRGGVPSVAREQGVPFAWKATYARSRRPPCGKSSACSPAAKFQNSEPVSSGPS